ncbi:MAG: c-type cytochrome [Longimicrobiales bacterium]
MSSAPAVPHYNSDEEELHMRMRGWSAILSGLALTAVVACGGGDAAQDAATDTTATPTPTPTPPPPAATAGAPPTGATAEMVAAGQQTFGSVCYACHGPDAKGTPLAPNLTDAEWINTDGTYDGIINIVKTGVLQPKNAPAAMPPMGGGQLTDDQVRAVAAYVWSLGGGK